MDLLIFGMLSLFLLTKLCIIVYVLHNIYNILVKKGGFCGNNNDSEL